MHPLARRAAGSKLLWTLAGLLLLYTVAGFFLVPYLIKRELPGLAEQKLGLNATLAEVRFNPFSFRLDAGGFEMRERDAEPLLAFKQLIVDFELSSLVRRAWTFGDIAVAGLDVRLQIDRDGELNLARLLERLRQPESKDPPPRMAFDRVRVTDGSVSLTDRSVEPEAVTRLSPLNLDLASVSTIPDDDGRYTLNANLPGGGTLAWKGTLSLQPPESEGDFNVTGLRLALGWQHVRDLLRIAEPGGQLTFSGRYRFAHAEGRTELDVTTLNAQVEKLALSTAEGTQLLALAQVRVADASMSLAKREITVPQATLAQGEIAARASVDGTLDWQQLVSARPAGNAEVVPENPAPGTAPWRVNVGELAVDGIALAFTDQTRKTPLLVRAGLQGSLKLGLADANFVTSDMSATLSSVTITASGAEMPLFALEAVTLTGGQIDFGTRVISGNNLSLRAGRTTIARGPGAAGLLQALEPAQVEAQEAPADFGARSKAWRYRLDAAELRDFAVRYADSTFQPALAYDAVIASLALKGVDAGGKAPVTFTVDARLGERGSLKASGNARQGFTQAAAKIDAANVALDPLRALLSQYALLDLKSGTVAASAQVNYRPDAKTLLTARGSAAASDVLVNETQTGDRFVSWKTLNADDFVLGIAPDQLTIREVRVVAPGMKILIAKDRSVNLTQVMKQNAAPAAQKPVESAAAQAPAFPVSVSRIRVEDGTLDFADLSLVLPFSTRVHALDGTLVGVSTLPQRRTELKLAGQIDNYGEARAEGALMLANPREFLDVAVHFDNVLLPPLSPYSVTFAGRKLAAGRLWLDLQYKIVNSELAGTNKILLDDFQLGERVEAPNALDLPLDLAVALLRDSDGKIRLAVPVTGNLDSPKFDYGLVIRSAIGNVLRNIITAPFRLLASLFGKSGGEEIRDVEFAPGSERIAPAQREKLDGLAQGLKARPQLKLIVRGPYSAERDGLQLKRDALRREVAVATGIRLKAEEDAGPLAFGDADNQRVLERLLTERGGKEAVRAFESDYVQRTGKKPQPVNPVLGLIGRGSADEAYYRAVFEKVAELTPLPADALQKLAAARASAIVESVGKAGVEPNRLETGEIAQVAVKDGAVPAQLALGAIGGGS